MGVPVLVASRGPRSRLELDLGKEAVEELGVILRKAPVDVRSAVFVRGLPIWEDIYGVPDD